MGGYEREKNMNFCIIGNNIVGTTRREALIGMCAVNKFLLGFLLIFLVFNCILASSAMFTQFFAVGSVVFEAPLWLEEGKYAKYMCKSSSVELTNFSSLGIDDGEATAIFYWECLSIEDNVARLNVTFLWSGNGTFKLVGAYDHVIGTGFKVFKWSKHVYVDLQKNILMSLNGTLIGPFLMWLPPRLEKGTTLEMYVNTDRWFECYNINDFNGEVVSDNRVVGKIVNGPQRSFVVEWEINYKYIVANRTKNSVYSSLYLYDWDTGVALSCSMELDPLLMIFGIREIGIQGLLPRISETNIDMGPRSFPIVSWLEIFLAVLFTVFVATFAVIYYRRRKIRRLMRKRLRKTT